MNDHAFQCHRAVPHPGIPARAATLAALLALALSSGSAVAATGGSANQPMSGSSSGSETPSAAGMSGSAQQSDIQQVMKASNLLHKDIKNSNGDEIASVEDLAIDPQNARVDYVILSTGGVLGAGNRTIAVPPQVLRPAGQSGQSQSSGGQTQLGQSQTSPSSGQTGQSSGQNTASNSSAFGGKQQLTITIADSDLKNMKAFDSNQWATLSDPNYLRDTYRAAGVQVPENAAPAAELAKASKLIGAKAQDRQGKNVGEVEDVAIDLQSGRAPFVEVSYGGILGMGAKHTAVPTPAVKVSSSGKEAVAIAASENQIKSGKRLDEQQWRSLNGQWISDIYALYGVTPYWQTAANGNAPANGNASASAGGAGGASSFAALDANGDGYISRSEAQRDPSLDQSFSTADANKDNKLDEAEFSRFEVQSGAGGSQGAPSASVPSQKQPGQPSQSGQTGGSAMP